MLKTFQDYTTELMAAWDFSRPALELYEEAAKKYAAQIADDRVQRIFDAIEPHFESGTDNIGYIYRDALWQLIQETKPVLP